MQANKKTGAGKLLLYSILLAAGASFFLWQSNGRPDSWFFWGKPDPLIQAIELIRSRYVDPISADSLRGLSLDSLAGKLDPHSVYLDADQLRVANEDLAGHFAGIGIEFSRIRDTVTVAFLMPEGPSLKAGIKTGDQLLAVNNRPLVGSAINNDSVRSLVRGPVGSIADLTIRSHGKIRKVSVERSDIPTPAVTAFYMLNDTTGYILLTKFSEGSYRETANALEKLTQKGMKSLVLDLRSNGGGFMQEAIEIADEFLADDRLIVYTQGAHQKKRSYTCKRPGLFEKGSVVVLMNELSASASEVLAGALQDWCRATIIGRRSFGKGLVQEQYELSNHGALRLTIARYFTPLGRCIQRPYTGDRSRYLQEPFEVRETKPSVGQKVYKSPCGDTLYAAGGIQPDIIIPKQVRSHSANGLQILNNAEIIQWAYRFYNENAKQVDSISDLSKAALKPPRETIQQFFKTQLSGVDVTGINPAEWDQIGFEFFSQIARFRKGQQEYIRIQNLQDPFLLEAMRSQTH